MQQPIKYFHNRLNSTNLLAAKMVSEQHEKIPFWIRTDDQFAGRGQGDNSWLSAAGQNLTGTLVIYPDHFLAVKQFSISQVFALSALTFLRLFAGDVTIKWPNDLYCGDKKAGGILIETAVSGQYLNHVILGIGLNINQVDFPKGLPNPVSIGMITGLQYDLQEMEELLITAFQSFFGLLENGEFSRIHDDYSGNLYRLGEWSRFRRGGEVFSARISGVNEFGQLLLERENGASAAFNYHELEYL